MFFFFLFKTRVERSSSTLESYLEKKVKAQFLVNVSEKWEQQMCHEITRKESERKDKILFSFDCY